MHSTSSGRKDIECVLEGIVAESRAGDPASATAQRHLRYLGATLKKDQDLVSPSMGEAALTVTVGSAEARRWLGDSASPVRASAAVSWVDPALSIMLDEPLLQGRSGLMEAHGRNFGIPRRLGIELVSIAAGVLNVQAVLACLLSQVRGGSVRRAETSALGAGLLFMSQYIAAATCGDPGPPVEPASEPGPPFCTADGHWFELEALDGDTWKAFWGALGLHGPQVGQAWIRFVQRYATGTVSMPEGPHAATRRVPLSQILSAADRSGASICRVRTSLEMVEELGLGSRKSDVMPSPWDISLVDTGPIGSALPAAPPGDHLPLTGVRVVEATRRIQGPLCGLLLQMLGAEIIRIEPTGGDSLRSMPPMVGDCSARFLALNREKPVVEINLKAPSGRKTLLDLIEHADAFIHNLAPGKATALALDAEDMWEINPTLVYTYASGWGSALGDKPPLGTDFLVQAQTGLGEALNPADEPPFNSLVTIADMMGGLIASEGTLAGLLLRSRARRGCRVDTSLFSASLGLQAHRLEAIASQGERARESIRPIWDAWDRPLRTEDGFLMLTLDGPAALSELCRVCGIPSGAANAGDLLRERFVRHPSQYWQQLLESGRILSVPVCTDLKGLGGDPGLTELFDMTNRCALVRRPWRFYT